MKELFDKIKFKKIHASVYRNDPNGSPHPVPYDLRIFGAREKTNHPPIDGKRFYRAYLVVDSNRVIHASLVFTKNLLARQLGFRKALTIGNCFTDQAYRGQGIYSAVLSRISADFPDQTLVVFVDPANTASVRGLEKAGFRKLYEFVMYRLLGICLHERKLLPAPRSDVSDPTAY